MIPELDLYFLPIPDPRSRGQKGTGSRTISATLLSVNYVRNEVQSATSHSNLDQFDLWERFIGRNTTLEKILWSTVWIHLMHIFSNIKAITKKKFKECGIRVG
jgi:hypothetical protein